MNDGQTHTDDSPFGELVRFLTQSREMRKIATHSFKQAAWSGGGALTGAIVMGPVGGLVGGLVGSVVGFLQAEDYDGAIQAILKLQDNRRQVLLSEVGAVLMKEGAFMSQMVTAAGFRDALCNYAEKDSVRNEIWKACVDTLKSQ
eukprot:CAMPEP_0118695234 /NCGR_PEP_ID=MMETSP0800-20121206/13058_1 /TAXON_ID=210618 ORGANISM="Striatella unipunctata, Strain CCMP2910" /NCGR_SAMPLE_ID=MMETSP0800 /ASSEMBLY_ACC=CAM_ASM_000638 /LENGTH=144 /DNA_ID=CAMNT_0006593973 /DNA_START=411 /DNA_END=845 /DNA_ORIENTATION=+